MVYNQGLAVGLGIGVPAAIILTVCFVIWTRNQRKQLKEDSLENGVDLDLRDNQSFNSFHEELHKPYNNSKILNKSNKSNEINEINEMEIENENETDLNDKNIEKQPYLISNTSSSTTNVTDITNSNSNSTNTNTNRNRNQYSQHSQHAPKNNANHEKTLSSYDFYETFIPILPHENSYSSNNTNINNHTTSNNNDLSQPPPLLKNNTGTLSDINDNGSTTTSIDLPNNTSPTNNTTTPNNNIPNPNIESNHQYTKSLENLAKQLAGPSFFEKLPSKAQPPRSIIGSGSGSGAMGNMTNNSSGDLIKNKLIDNININDNFIFEAGSKNHQNMNSQNNQQQASSSQSTTKQESIDNVQNKEIDELKQIHPYRRLNNNNVDDVADDSVDRLKNNKSPFDDDDEINDVESQPDVIFK